MNSVGLELKKIREEKKISLQEIANTTNIKVEYLILIESDEFHKLPTLVHAKGFVRSYANFLGLNGLDFSKRVSILKQDEKDSSKNKIKINKIKPSFSFKKIKQELKEYFKHYFDKYKKQLIIGLVLIVSVFLIYKISKTIVLSIKNKFKKIEVKELVSPVLKQDKKIVKIDKKKQTNEKQTKTKSKQIKAKYPVISQGLKLHAIAKNKVWLSVRVDGNIVYEGTLNSQASELWKAKNKINLKIGDAGALELILNGVNLGRLGQRGEVIKDLVLTKTKMEIN